MATHDPSTILRLVDVDLDWRSVEGEVLALDFASSEYLGVNRMGAVLWRALAVGVARAGLVEQLVASSGIAVERAERDVARFLEQLRERRLLVEPPGGLGPD
jgi:hypothetical protein